MVARRSGAPRRPAAAPTAAPSHEPAAHDLLRPVDEAVGHHVERHVHLDLAHHLLHRVGDEQPQGAEGEGVEHDAELARLAPFPEGALHLDRDLRPLLLVGGVGVEEPCLPAERLDLGNDALGIGQGGLAVEVHPEDMTTRPRQGEARGGAESRGRPEDQGPAGELDR